MCGHICFGEALKPRKKELEVAERKLREKNESKKRSRELQEAPEESQSHDVMALPNDYERREALERAAKSRSIGPVDVSEPPGAQNSNSGGVEAAILDTFIVFEPPGGPLGPLHFDPPGIPTKHQGRAPAPFLSETSILRRRGLDFRFPRKTTSPKTD